MSTLTANPEYNIYSAIKDKSVIFILERLSDSLVVTSPDYGYATGRMIDSYKRTIDTLVFGELPTDITEVTYQASFSSDQLSE